MLLLVAGCGGAGPYGFAREYVALGAEEQYAEAASGLSYEEVRRDPADFQSTLLGWFGIVTSVEPQGDGTALVRMTYRTLSARNLCADERDSSCRVTVSERAGGPFTAIVRLSSAELTGNERVWAGSLLKIYGNPTGELDPETGGPILRAVFHRHWPHGKYVTTGARAVMRR